MVALLTGARFSQRVSGLLARIDHHCVDRFDESAFANLFPADAAGQQAQSDPASGAHKSWTITTVLDGELAAVVRINVAQDARDRLPSLGLFHDEIMPRIKAGQVIVEASRPLVNSGLYESLPELSYVALRPAWLAARYFEADYLLAAINDQHRAFYAYSFGFAPWGEPHDDERRKRKVWCMALDVPAAKRRIEARYSFFASQATERSALFGRSNLRRDLLA